VSPFTKVMSFQVCELPCCCYVAGKVKLGTVLAHWESFVAWCCMHVFLAFGHNSSSVHLHQRCDVTSTI
jgi:hypothetical protein